MKKLITLLMIIFIVNNVNGQSEIDSLLKEFQAKFNEELSLRNQHLDSLQNYLSQLILDRDNEIKELRIETSNITEELKQVNVKLGWQYSKSENIESALNSYNIKLSVLKDSSKQIRDSVFYNIGMLQNNLNLTSNEIEDVQMKSEMSNKAMQERLTYLFAAIALIILLLIAMYRISGKRNNNVRSELRNAKAGLEAQINNANADFAEKLERTLNDLWRSGKDGVPSPQDKQGLILDFAQQIASMENNIWHLPEDDRVRKRIERATKKMRDTFMSLGYEMPKLLGTEVSDNQTIVIKNISEDSTIPAGTRVITKIVKPSILFNSKMVQIPTVDIKQNTEE
jgi:hypothetical protein